MTTTILLRILPHSIAELAAALVIITLVAQAWKNTPGSFLVSLTGNVNRILVAFAFLIAPTVLGSVLRMLFPFTPSSPGYTLWMGISMIDGVFLGIASSCVAAPPSREYPFRTKAAMGIAALFVLLPLGFVGMRTGELAAISFILRFAVLVVAYIALGKNAPAHHSPPALPDAPTHPKSPALALVIGFMPSTLGLLMIMISANSHLNNSATREMLVSASIVSLLCCVTASVMLFRRRPTGFAIAGVIMLMLLNAFIAFFTGCLSAFIGTSFH